MGDFEYHKIIGGREINGQTGLPGDYTDTYFPVMASIFNRLPNTKVWFDVSDAASGVQYKLSAIAYNRRVWMRSGAKGEFDHGGLMLSGGWSAFRRENNMVVGDTVIISRKEGKIFLGCAKGSTPELLERLSGHHQAKAAAMAAARSLMVYVKREQLDRYVYTTRQRVCACARAGCD
jgi:hypothetical protein